MSFLIDTNVLIRSLIPSHPQFVDADAAIAKLRTRGEDLYLAAQNLYEYWVVATRPSAENGFGLSSVDASSELKRLRNLYRVLADIPAILEEWETLVTCHAVMGKNGHDARLVAAMKVHGITSMLSFNKQDFLRYPEIQVKSPQDVLTNA
ncbi:MAG: type II toxin-antitoxin system VapC family toxin [Gemmatales bacterium]